MWCWCEPWTETASWPIYIYMKYLQKYKNDDNPAETPDYHNTTQPCSSVNTSSSSKEICHIERSQPWLKGQTYCM